MTSSAPRRIVTVIDSLQAGGGERVAIELACALDRERFEPHVLVTRGDGPLRDLLDRDDVPYTILDRQETIDVGAWRRAHHLVADHADLLHAHKFGSNAWGALLARTTGVPLVAHEHNFSDRPSRSRAFIDRRWIASRAARILCVSESVAQAERTAGVPEHLLDVVLNGVRVDAAWPRGAARAELGLGSRSFTIGIVGRLRPEKAHEVLLEAMAELARSGRDVRLCVVGDGPRRSELKLLAAQLGIDSRVTWAGERRDAATIASAFDIAVTCSHWEGLPLASMEAMAAGVPLVASSVGGLPTLLADGAGVLVEPADPTSLARALRLLMDDDVERGRIAEAGRRRIESGYSFEAMVERIEGVYESVLSEQQQRARRRRGRRRSAAKAISELPTTGREAA